MEEMVMQDTQERRFSFGKWTPRKSAGICTAVLVVSLFAVAVTMLGVQAAVQKNRFSKGGSLGPFSNLDCSFSQGFWKNHEGARPDGGDLTLGDLTYTSAQITLIMKTPASIQRRVVSQMIAAMYNIASGSSSTQDVDSSIAGLHDLVGSTNLTTDPIGGSSEILQVHNDVLSAYNEGDTGPGACDDKGCPVCPTGTLGTFDTGTCPETCPTTVTCDNVLTKCDFQAASPKVRVKICDFVVEVKWTPTGTVVAGTTWNVTFATFRFGAPVKSDGLFPLVRGPFALEYEASIGLASLNKTATEMFVVVQSFVPGCPDGPIFSKGPIDLIEPLGRLKELPTI